MRSVLVAALLLASACSTTGRDLPPAAAPAPIAADEAGDVDRQVFPRTIGEDAMAVFGADFEPGGAIPSYHSLIEGGSPLEVEWSGVAPDTVELAMIVLDVDNADFSHWVIVGIDPTLDALDADPLPAGIIEMRNDTGATGWLGLSPPDGVTHRYQVWFYALTQPFALDPLTVEPLEARTWLDANAASIATVMGTLTGPTCAEVFDDEAPECANAGTVATLPQVGVTVEDHDTP